MELTIMRFKNSTRYTAGKLFINTNYFCYTLEDTNRFLSDEMDLDIIKKVKVKANTAIPTGRYEVVVSYSNRFKKQMPLLLGVKGFEGIRIHAGNKHEDTEGCILAGYEDSSDGFMGESRKAVEELYNIIFKTIETEKIFITV